jgi:hypothetical protein
MVRCASLLRFAGKEGLSPSAWLARANDDLCETVAGGTFVCAAVGYYDPASEDGDLGQCRLPAGAGAWRGGQHIVPCRRPAARHRAGHGFPDTAGDADGSQPVPVLRRRDRRARQRRAMCWASMASST